MKNKIVLCVVFAMMLVVVLGCGWISPFGGSSESSKTGDSKTEGKSTSDNGIDSVIVEKTGVPECDELTAYFSELISSKDDGFMAKATREFIINRYREAIRKSIEDNKGDPEKMAKYCKEYKTQLETFKKEEDSKKAEN